MRLSVRIAARIIFILLSGICGVDLTQVDLSSMEPSLTRFLKRRPSAIGILTLLAALLLIYLLRVQSITPHSTNVTQTSARELRKTSYLHYVIPSSFINDAVCAGVVSALLNGYPIPTIIGYKAKDEFDAADHLAKVRLLKRFLDTLIADDDDLVIVVDSVDVLAQVPVQVTIERYFQIRAQSEQRLADQRGITIEQLHDLGIHQTILYGAGKPCFIAPDEPLCPLMPASNSALYRFRVKTEKEGREFRDSRYLNSGTIMGPVGDLRRFIHAVLDLVEADDTVIEDWDLHGKIIHHMDQWFTATLYVRQEYHRARDMNGGEYPGDLTALAKIPKPRQGVDDTTEFHVFVDYDSLFTQTQCWNELEIHSLGYDKHDLTAYVTEDFLAQGSVFRPYSIQMPSNLYRALGKVWEKLHSRSIDDNGAKRKWIQDLKLATNVASGNVFAFYHNTCDKTHFLEQYRNSWFYPYILPLLRSAHEELRKAATLHPGLVDGRRWMPSSSYPTSDREDLANQSDIGGMFTDLQSEPYLDLRSVCHL